MRILIFGCTGMLGRALMKEAFSRSYTVFGASRSGSDVIVDFEDMESIIRAVDATSPDIIINAAALVNLMECERDPGKAYIVNARPMALLAKLATERNIYVIQISTDHYYSGDGDMLHDETYPVQFNNEYSRSKFVGEAFTLTTPKSLVVRTNIVGFRGDNRSQTFTEWVIDNLENQRKMTLFYDFYTSSITVSQLSHALFDMIEKKNHYGVVNIASRGSYSKKSFIEHLAQRFGFTIVQPEYGSVHENSTVPRSESLGLDVSKAEEILCYSMPDLEQVIDQLYIDYQRGFNT
ncbi:dTDP-4-dehydrorhamnose reductase [compost metagenome]